jgi:hypothetical protein
MGEHVGRYGPFVPKTSLADCRLCGHRATPAKMSMA